MPRARFTRDLIAELRARVIAHNEGGGERVRLEELKKAYAANHRGGRAHENAMGGVERLLLRKADDQPRAPNGRWVSMGGGQRGLYGDVGRREQHQQLKDENAGYAAAQTAVIPETRFTQLGPAAAAMLGIAEGAVRGFNAKPPYVQHSKSMIARVLAAPTYLVPLDPLAGARRFIHRVGDSIDSAQDNAFLATSRRINSRLEEEGDKAVAGRPTPRTWKERRLYEFARAKGRGKQRAKAALAGAALYGIPQGALYAAGARLLGPYADSIKGGREIEKMLKVTTDPVAREALMKAGGMNLLWSKVSQVVGRRAAPAVAQAPKLTATQAAAGPKADAVLNRFKVGRAARATAMIGGAAAAGGAAAGLTYAGMKARGNPYRDEDGRFTSKEKAVIAGVGAAGAIAGAVLAGRGVNAATRKKIAEYLTRFDRSPAGGARGAMTTGKASAERVKAQTDAAEWMQRGQARRAAADTGPKPTDEGGVKSWQAGVQNRIKEATQETDDIAARFGAAWEKEIAARPVAGGQNTARARNAAIRALEDGRKTKSFHNAMERATQAGKAEAAQLAAAANQGFEEWGRLNLARVRDQKALSLVSQKGAKGGFWEGARDVAKLREETQKALVNPTTKQVDVGAAIQVLERRGAVTQAKALRDVVAAHDAELTRFKGVAQQITGRATALRAQADEAAREVTQLETSVAAARAKIDTLSNQLAALADDAPAAEKRKLDRALSGAEKRLSGLQERLSGAVQARSHREADAAKAEALLTPGRASPPDPRELKNVLNFDADRGGMPVPRNPYGKGDEYLAPYPTPRDVTDFEARKIAERVGEVRDGLAQAAVKAGREAGEISEQVETYLRDAIKDAPPGKIAEIADRIGQRMSPYLRDMRYLGGELKGWGRAQLGDLPTRVARGVTAAADMGDRALFGAKDAAGNRTGRGVVGYAKDNWKAGVALGAATGIGGAFGFDLRADGRIDFDYVKAREAVKDPGAAFEEVKRQARGKTGGYVRLFKPMSDQQAIITGVVVKTKDGRDVFLAGEVEVGVGKNRRVETIPPMSLVADIENRWNGGGQGGGNQQGGKRVGDDELRRKASDLANKVTPKDEEIGGRKVRMAGDASKLQGDDKGAWNQTRDRLMGALRKAGQDIGNDVAGKADQVFAVMNTVFGREGNILTAGQKNEALLAAAGRVGQEIKTTPAADATGLAKQMERLIEEWPAPRNPEEAGRMKDAVRVLGTHLTQASVRNFDPLDEKIDARVGKGGGQQQREQRQQQSKADDPPFDTDPPKAGGGGAKAQSGGRWWNTFDNSDSWDDDEWVSQGVKRAEFAIQRALKPLRSSGTPESGSRADQLMRAEGSAARDISATFRALRRQQANAGEETLMRQAIRTYLAAYDITDDSWDWVKAREMNQAAPTGDLRKEFPAQGGPRRPFDETKIKRESKGSDRGGEFAPKAGASAAGAAPRAGQRNQPPPEDDRSYFEPVRFGGTMGGVVGGQAAWELLNRRLPKAATMKGKTRNFVISMLGSAMAGGAGSMAGERAGAATYEMRGRRAPDSYEEPERPGGEEAARAVGAMLGSFASVGVKRFAPALAVGVAGQLAGEEVMAAAYRVAARRFGWS